MKKGKGKPEQKATRRKSTVRLADLKPDARNARRHNERNVEMIADSLREVGAARSVVIDERDSVLAGNATVEAAQKAGITHVRVVEATGEEIIAVRRRGLTRRQKTRLALFDNRTAELAEWEPEILAELEPADLDGLFSGDELADILGGDEAEAQEDDFDAAAAAAAIAEPKTKLGDLWLLGEHRLLCGDAREPESVTRLLRGERAQFAYMDPPYGIAIVSQDIAVENRIPAALGKVGGDKAFGKVGTIHRGMKAKPLVKISANVYAPIIGDESTDTACAALALCDELKVRTRVFWGANHYAHALPDSPCWIVWDKDNGESFFADAELAWTNHKTAVRIFKHKWNGLIKASERGDKRVHPTQKPIALAAWCFEKYGRPDDIVLDLFAGSGSTLIACEQTKHPCRMMELSPIYCDVIVARWEKFTGETAALETES